MKVNAKFILAFLLVFLLLEFTTTGWHIISANEGYRLLQLLKQPIQESLFIYQAPGHLLQALVTVLFFNYFAKGVLKNYLSCGEVTLRDGLIFGVFLGLLTAFTGFDFYTSLQNKGFSWVLLEVSCLLVQGLLCGGSLGLVYKSD